MITTPDDSSGLRAGHGVLHYALMATSIRVAGRNPTVPKPPMAGPTNIEVRLIMLWCNTMQILFELSHGGRIRSCAANLFHIPVSASWGPNASY